MALKCLPKIVTKKLRFFSAHAPPSKFVYFGTSALTNFYKMLGANKLVLRGERAPNKMILFSQYFHEIALKLVFGLFFKKNAVLLIFLEQDSKFNDFNIIFLRFFFLRDRNHLI